MRQFASGLLFSLLLLAGCSSTVVISDSISPAATQSLDAGQSVVLTATVVGDSSNSGVTWILSGAGALSNVTTATATYTAPAATAAGIATITATPVKNALFVAATQVNYAPVLTIASSSLPAGTIGTAYSSQLTATGGSGAITWSLVSGTLPAGLTLSASGLISGTPTALANASFSVRATDSAATPLSATAALTLNVNAIKLTIPGSTLANGVVLKSYSATLSETGGIAPYTFSIASGTLPTGLTLSSAGVLSGTPTVAGTYSFTVGVVDTEPSPQTATQSYTLTIYSALSVTTATLPSGSLKNAYSATLASTGGTLPVTFSLASGTLPAGLTLSSAGLLSGTPTAAGTSTFTVQATDTSIPVQTATASYTVSIVLSTLAITTTTLPQGTAGTAYSATLTSSGGNAPVTWSLASGSLPTGFTLSSAGVISGLPTAATTASFTVQATDSTPASVTQPLTLTIVALSTLSITTASLPAGNIGTGYSSTLAATGGATPYTWSVALGTLPVGLSLSSAGVLSGTPLAAGSYTFTAQVKDSESTPVTASRQFTVTIGTTLATGSANATLSGSYGFLLNGFAAGSASGKVYGFAAIGSLALNGAGAVTGVEDINSASGVQTSVSVTGTYTLGSDGRGLMVLTAGTSSTVYAIAASNAVSGVSQTFDLTEFDNTGTAGSVASGLAKRQTAAAFAASTLKGTFAFGLSGESPCNTCATSVRLGPLAAAGVFTGDGSATLSAGQEDAAAYGANYSGVTLAGSFTTPSTATGRGTLKLTPTGTIFSAAPPDFTYVIVGANELLMMSNDTHATNALLYGDVQLQQMGTFTAASLTGQSIGYESQASGGDGATTYPTALNAILSELAITGSGTANLLQDANRAGTFTAGTSTAVTYATAGNGRTVITTGGTSQVLYLYNTGAGMGLDQAAASGFPAAIRYELQVATAPYPTLLSGGYAAGTLAAPVPATLSSGRDVFTLFNGGVDAGLSGTLSTLTDSSSPAGVLSFDQTASPLYTEDATGRHVVIAAGTKATLSIVDAITSTRAVSLPVTTSPTPTVTVLQQ